MDFPTRDLRRWFKAHKRELPFRDQPTPYRVWISEVMLQQTQVQVVLPYFRRWMKAFNSIEQLAAATEEEVIKQWEGLGYYSRARHLRSGAQMIVSKFGGVMPSEREELESIPGIGPYTAGAILSFAFKKKAVALDGNVMRVLSRFFQIEEEIDRPKVVKQMEQYLEKLIDVELPFEVMEGLIELGALVCKKKAECHACPLSKGCLAKKNKVVDALPRKRAKVKVEQLYWDVPLILHRNRVLVKKEEKGIMKGLWVFPTVEVGKKLKGSLIEEWEEVKHGFTRYRATLYPKLCLHHEGIKGFEWVKIEELDQLPFPSGHRRIKEELVHNCERLYALEKSNPTVDDE